MHRRQLIHLERLFQVIERALLHRVHGRLDGGVSGDDNDGGGRIERARLLQDFQAVRAGFVKIEVGDDQFRALGFEGFDGVVEGAKGKDLVPFAAQEFGDHLDHGHFVVNQ